MTGAVPRPNRAIAAPPIHKFRELAASASIPYSRPQGNSPVSKPARNAPVQPERSSMTLRSEPFSPYPAPGEVIDGKYRCERLIGSGGMGAVVQATHLLRKAPVALKFMNLDIVGQASHV